MNGMHYTVCLHTYTALSNCSDAFIVSIIKRRSGINPIPPTVIDRD